MTFEQAIARLEAKAAAMAEAGNYAAAHDWRTYAHDLRRLMATAEKLPPVRGKTPTRSRRPIGLEHPRWP